MPNLEDLIYTISKAAEEQSKLAKDSANVDHKDFIKSQNYIPIDELIKQWEQEEKKKKRGLNPKSVNPLIFYPSADTLGNS